MLPRIDSDWRPVLGFEGLYEVSCQGGVKSLERFHLLEGRHPEPYYRKVPEKVLTSSGDPYLQVGLYKDGVCTRHLVHRLVALAFWPDELGPEVNHINENKKDNRAVNLEWCTRSENAIHSVKKFRGSNNGTALLNEGDVLNIVKLLSSGKPQTEIGKRFGVTNHTIHKIKSGKNWAWLTGLGKEDTQHAT